MNAARRWGRVVLVGEVPDLHDVDVSHAIISKQVTIFGSWVTSTKHMEGLVERLAAWRLNLERIVTHTFSLNEAAEAYRTADGGASCKVCIAAAAAVSCTAGTSSTTASPSCARGRGVHADA